MVIISFNAKGVGGSPKKLALKILLQSLKPNILLIQEMMCPGEKSRELISKCLRNWPFYIVDIEGMSGGLILGWSPYFLAQSSSFV
jgi:hypothetical protein